MNQPIIIAFLILASVAMLLVLFFMGRYVGLWLQALFSGHRIPFIEIVMTRMRGEDPRQFVQERLEDTRHELIGARGTTETAVGSPGLVTIDGEPHKALVESGVIEPGTEVEVVGMVDDLLEVRARW